MKITFDLHDLSLQNNNLWYIDKLREQYPGFKLSAFYIPYDLQYYNRINEPQIIEAKGMIRSAVAEGWLELIPHGLTHTFGEFHKADYKSMEMAIQAYEEYFKEFDCPYVKGFCAPNWLISEEAVKCLDDKGWWMAVDKNQPNMPRTKKFYEYNWSIDQEFPNLPLVKAHGHISPPSLNSLPDCIINLSTIPGEYEWDFVSSLMK